MSKRLAVIIGELSRDIDALDVEFANKLKITVNGLRVLDQLYQADVQKASALARSVGMTPTSFTPTLDGLERAGLITRRFHTTDRRAKLISLTPKAEKLRRDIVGHADAIQTRLQTVLNMRVMQAPIKLADLFAPLPQPKPF